MNIGVIPRCTCTEGYSWRPGRRNGLCSEAGARVFNVCEFDWPCLSRVFTVTNHLHILCLFCESVRQVNMLGPSVGPWTCEPTNSFPSRGLCRSCFAS